jgi:uncharacterized protein (TIGR02246 family)
MRRLFILTGVICLTFTFLLACAPRAEKQAGPAADESFSVEADVEAVRRVNEDLIDAFNAGEVEAAVSLVMDDAVDLPPNRPPVVGKEAIREFVLSDLEKFNWQFIEEVVEVQVSGDLAVLWSNYSVTLTFNDDGRQIESNGKWIKILKRQPDGSWKFSRNIWNSNNPPPVQSN